eukprot:scaffold7863_cov37-Cyclotella_meneghiniana.AAC.8
MFLHRGKKGIDGPNQCKKCYHHPFLLIDVEGEVRSQEPYQHRGFTGPHPELQYNHSQPNNSRSKSMVKMSHHSRRRRRLAVPCPCGFVAQNL